MEATFPHWDIAFVISDQMVCEETTFVSTCSAFHLRWTWSVGSFGLSHVGAEVSFHNGLLNQVRCPQLSDSVPGRLSRCTSI